MNNKIAIVYIKETLHHYCDDCGSFDLSNEAKIMYLQKFGIEFDKLDVSRNFNFNCYSESITSSKRYNQKLVDIVQFFGDKTCTDCILGLEWIDEVMAIFFKITCNLNKGRNEKVIFMDDKYTMYLLQDILYYDIKSNIVNKLCKLLENKKNILRFDGYEISLDVVNNILYSDNCDYVKIINLMRSIKYIYFY
jgi:hypothetical protein